METLVSISIFMCHRDWEGRILTGNALRAFCRALFCKILTTTERKGEESERWETSASLEQAFGTGQS